MRAPRGVGAANGAVSRGTPPARIARNGPAATQPWRIRRTHPRWGEARDRVRGRRRAPSRPTAPPRPLSPQSLSPSVSFSVSEVRWSDRPRAPTPDRRAHTGQVRPCRSDAAGAVRHSTRIVTDPRSTAGRRPAPERQDADSPRRDRTPAPHVATGRRPPNDATGCRPATAQRIAGPGLPPGSSSRGRGATRLDGALRCAAGTRGRCTLCTRRARS